MILVLVVDDSPLFASGIHMLIDAQPEMRSVGVARNGQEALATARTTRPDVILMDLRMPVMTGIEATRLILREAQPDAVPQVIVLTTIKKDEAVYQALRAGASAFLTKDATPARLLTAIRDAAAARSLPEHDESMSVVAAHAAASTRSGEESLRSLSAREREVFTLVARGLGNGEIASSLHLSEATVKSHVRSVLAKLALKTRVQLVVFAYESRLAEELGRRTAP
jgi:DNA-binding NarL/FixJ family response regulator